MMPSRFDTGKHTAIPPPISKTTTPAINRPHRPKKEEDDPFGSMKEAKKTKKKTPPIDRPKKSHFKPALTVGELLERQGVRSGRWRYMDVKWLN
jgi:hypothetical protein